MSDHITNVCGLPFVPPDDESGEWRVLLSRYKIAGVPVYDGFGGRILHDPRDLACREKSLSEYVNLSTGVLTRPEDWTEIITLMGDGCEVGFYFICCHEFEQAVSRKGDEPVGLEKMHSLPINIIPSLKWLIPLAMDESVVKPLSMSGIKL